MPFKELDITITHEDLRSRFETPLAQVAREFGVSLTYLKKVCRSHGIARWPYRKLKAMQHKATKESRSFARKKRSRAEKEAEDEEPSGDPSSDGETPHLEETSLDTSSARDMSSREHGISSRPRLLSTQESTSTLASSVSLADGSMGATEGGSTFSQHHGGMPAQPGNHAQQALYQETPSTQAQPEQGHGLDEEWEFSEDVMDPLAESWEVSPPLGSHPAPQNQNTSVLCETWEEERPNASTYTYVHPYAATAATATTEQSPNRAAAQAHAPLGWQL